MRTFLFLQGPQGPFFRRLGKSLKKSGHEVLRVNFHGGDAIDWRGGLSFRGWPEEWPPFADGLLEQHRVTDLVVYGDCRPVHAAAIEAARKRSVNIHVFEEAYFRPGYLALERGGTNGNSPLPQDADNIREMAKQISQTPQPFRQKSRGTVAIRHYSAAYLSKHLGSFPRAEWHRDASPVQEGLGYLRRFLNVRRDSAKNRKALSSVSGTRYFLLPLQMNRDFQLRSHSPFGSMEAALKDIISDFEANAPEDAHLLLKRHPLDNGLIDWRRYAGHPRIFYVTRAKLGPLTRAAAGVVTVNSTSALPALGNGVPVKALGTAIYDVEGLTDRQPLSAFWHAPTPPDTDLFSDFRKVVVSEAQIPGYYSSDSGIEMLISHAIPRLLEAGSVPCKARKAA